MEVLIDGETLNQAELAPQPNINVRLERKMKSV